MDATTAAATPAHAKHSSLSRGAHAVRRWLPTGNTLPEPNWVVRHRQIRAVLWAHAAGLLLYTVWFTARGGESHVIAEAGLVGLLAFVAGRRGMTRRTQAAAATLGLFTSSAVITHLAGGLIEAHFHFFVMVVVVSLYQSWLPFLLGLGFVLLHHGVGGVLWTSSVFEHPEGAADPWTWAAVHAMFILMESVACMAAWRVNEDALGRERTGRLLLKKAHKDLVHAQELSRVGSWEFDVRSGQVVWSPQMFKLLGVDPSTTPDHGLLLRHVHPDDRALLDTQVQRMLTSPVPVEFEHRMNAQGRQLVVRARGAAVFTDGELTHLRGTTQDVTEHRRLQREIEHRAFHDPLTGLGNRALFIDRLTHALALRERSHVPLAALYLDLDDFKTVNDSLGHGAGDALLTAVAERLRTTMRPGDTIARLGGDEFAVLLEDTDLGGAERAAERILETLSLPVPIDERSVAVRASIGIAAAADGLAAADMLRNADIAMYAAKRDGKSSYRAFTADMLTTVVNRMERIAELRAAVEDEQFTVHYQPIIDLQTGDVRGVEALVRWTHPRLGTVPPMDFIPLAEDTGLIVPLGAWITRTATRDARAMQDTVGSPLSLSLNLSAAQFTGDVVSMVAGALGESGLAPEHLIVELTESCLVEQGGQVVEQLAALRRMGVRVAIDDFGTGYSSMSYLRDLPVDVLKIDRSFIQHVAEGGEQSALAEAIITLSQAFELDTIAEGIETSAQAQTLVGYGCRTGQGFLYAKPQPLGEVLRTLAGAADARPALTRAAG